MSEKKFTKSCEIWLAILGFRFALVDRFEWALSVFPALLGFWSEYVKTRPMDDVGACKVWRPATLWPYTRCLRRRAESGRFWT